MDFNFDFDPEKIRREILAKVRADITSQIESVRCDEHPDERAAVEWDAENHMQVRGSCPTLKAKIEQKLSEIGAHPPT